MSTATMDLATFEVPGDDDLDEIIELILAADVGPSGADEDSALGFALLEGRPSAYSDDAINV